MTGQLPALIFAAGFGTRMAPLTDDLPKPLIHVAGRPLIDHAIEQLPGIAPLVANAHYRADQLVDYLTPKGVTVVVEDTILDTGGGLKNALDQLNPSDGPVITMNSDAVWTGTNAAQQLVRAWDDAHMDALLLCIPPSMAIGHRGPGDFLIGPDHRLTQGPGVIYSGAQIIHPRLLAGIDDDVFSMHRLWTRALKSRRAFGIVHDGYWCDVGHPGGIALAEEMLEQAGV